MGRGQIADFLLAHVGSDPDRVVCAVIAVCAVAMVLLCTAVPAGAEATTTTTIAVDLTAASFSFSNSDLAHKRGVPGVSKVVVSDGASGGYTSYEVRSVTAVEGWGTVVIGETVAGHDRVYVGIGDAGAAHLTLHHRTGAQKLFTDGPRVSRGLRDRRALPDEAEPVSSGGGNPARRSRCDPGKIIDRATGRTVIRVGVLHTPEVLATAYYAGSSAAVQAEVAVAVGVGNAEAFPLSGVSVKLELCVNAPLPPGTPSLEKRSPRRTLDAFATSSAVEKVRADNQCDTMVLFATLGALGDAACGIGFVPGAHAVVAADCFVDNFSFLHELGHNLGACHGPPAGVCSAGSNGYGDAANGFRTLLAYSTICSAINCTRVPRYSNSDPAFTWRGHAIGDARSDNARTINGNKDAMAAKEC